MASSTERLASKIASRSVSPAVRARTATFHQPGAPAGTEKNRFPMPDVKHARLALQMLPRAKNLSDSQRAAIRARANSKLSGRRAAAARAAGR